MKSSIILLCFAFIPLNIKSQIHSSIDIVGSYDFINTISYPEGLFLFPNGNQRNNRGGRGGSRIGFNANFRIFDNVLFKTGIRFSKQGYLSGGVATDIISLDIFAVDYIFHYLDEYYIEIPVIFRYEIVKKRFAIFIELGVSPHRYLKGKKVIDHILQINSLDSEDYFILKYNDSPNTMDFDIPYLKDTRIRLAYVFGIGLNYDLTKNNQFFVQPTFRYYPSIKSETSLSEGTLKNMGIEIGMRRALSFAGEN